MFFMEKRSFVNTVALDIGAELEALRAARYADEVNRRLGTLSSALRSDTQLRHVEKSR